MRAGAAVVLVDVPVGTQMWGYAARLGGSTGVHDALSVRALVVDRVGLVAIDCCALTVETCQRIRRDSELDDVFVCATHTHSGPCLTPVQGGPAEGVLRDVVAAAGRALARAEASAVPCRVSRGRATGLGVARNRRHLDRPIDPPLEVIGFTTPDRVVATLVSYACHAVVLDAANREISADYPGVLRATVERSFPGSVCVFATGCAGDVNDGHPPDASFTAEAMPRRTFAEAARVGRLLGDAAVAALERGREVATTGEPPTAATATVELVFAPPAQAAVRADRDAWRARAEALPPTQRALYGIWTDWADDWLATSERQTTWISRVGLLRLGELTVVTLPCEPFLGVADAIQRRLGEAVVLGYTDGVVGYLPTADAYPEGGYEVEEAHRYYGMPGPFARGTAEGLVDTVVRLAGARQ